MLQLCFYSDGIASVQGRRPEHMHVFLGIGEQRALRYDDFAAYYRRVRARFEDAVARRRQPRPIRSSIAALCSFRGCVDQHGRTKTISCMSRVCAASKSCDCATLDCRR